MECRQHSFRRCTHARPRAAIFARVKDPVAFEREQATALPMAGSAVGSGWAATARRTAVRDSSVRAAQSEAGYRTVA